MPPTQLLSSSPPPQPAKSSDNKVVVDNTTAKQSLLQNQSRDQVNAISFAPKEPDATEPAAQATRPPSGNRGASSRGTKVKSSATGKAPLVQSGQSQLTRLGFHASSSSPPRATSVTPAPMTRGPGYYSAEGPRTRPPESPQKQSSPQTPKKRVHFFESPNKKGNDNYYTPKQRDGPALRAPNSPGTPMQTSSSAPRTISSPKTPRSAVRKQFEKLVMNMDEVQLYITYSRAFKEVEAKMANNPPKKVKDELQEKWARKRKDMELTREQNYRFKKLYKQIQEEDKERAENRKKAQREGELKQRSLTSTRQGSTNAGKRDMSATTKTGPLKVVDNEYEFTDNNE